MPQAWEAVGVPAEAILQAWVEAVDPAPAAVPALLVVATLPHATMVGIPLPEAEVHLLTAVAATMVVTMVTDKSIKGN